MPGFEHRGVVEGFYGPPWTHADRLWVIEQLGLLGMKDGKSLGFRVFNIRSGSLFERMGLKNGDVIQSVNGTTLDDPSRALALLDEVQSADEITVDLLRDDHPNTLTYSIR